MALIFFLATMPRPSMKALPRRKGNSGFGWGGWFFGASMKALPRRKGNALAQGLNTQTPRRLNESPSQKEGKYFCFHRHAHSVDASMKAPPKRKGNLRWLVRACSANLTLNESPSEKEGKFPGNRLPSLKSQGLNESPSEKEGKCSRMRRQNFIASPPQ